MFSKKDKQEKEPKPQDEFRRAMFGGIRKEDVERALAVLEQRNQGLETELAAAEQEAHGLLDRVTAAEGTLVTFHATLEQMGTLLSLAEERARQIEESANAEAAVVRAEADARVREAEAEVTALVDRKQEALDTLAALRSSLPEVAPTPEPMPEVATPRVTVADLIALEANSGISA
jgi:phage-related minor tail protein